MRIVLVSVLLLLAPASLFAQSQLLTEASRPRIGVFIATVFNGNNPADNSTTASRVDPGIAAGVDFRLLGPVGGEAQVGFSFNTSGTDTITLVDYLVGPRVQARVSNRLAPFGDFLVGGQHLSNSDNQHRQYYINGTGMATAGDIGADFRLVGRIAARAQFGFVFSNFAVGGAGPVGNYRWRAGVGLVYRF